MLALLCFAQEKREHGSRTPKSNGSNPRCPPKKSWTVLAFHQNVRLVEPSFLVAIKFCTAGDAGRLSTAQAHS